MNKKIIAIFLLIITISNVIIPKLQAIEIKKANLIKDHSINTHIMYKPNETWVKIKGSYICYTINGEKYPAYCISHGIHGVDEEGNYNVTINDLLKDKLIYNTILNGYPYKTPQQLGVESADDAYIATKQAVYSVLLERNVKEFYKAVDSRGEKIIDAIYKISQKGKEGNNLNQDANLKIKKIDEIKETGKYYYQEYAITANVNIKEYTIESIKGFSDNAYISDVDGNKKEKFDSSENFRIMIPKEDFEKNISGKINIKADCKTNPIFFGEAPNKNVQNYAVTYKPYMLYTVSENVNINTNTAKIKIIKKDKECLEPISGVKFGLYDKKDNLIDTQKTNEKGEIEFKDLYQNKYYVKEIKPAEGYLENKDIYEINVKYNETYIKEVLNEHKKGNLKLLKIDKEDNKITLGGIEFDLINSKGKIIEHLITNADGECYIENINTGDYVLKETRTKKEYRLSEDKAITINWNETADIVIENEKKKGRVEIYKVDSEDNNIKLKNVEFEILDENNLLKEKLTTNENGYAISGELEAGTYYLKETKTNSKYVLNNKKILMNIEDNKTLTLNLENSKIKGNIKLIKKTSDNSELLKLNKGDRISEVKFEIYDINKNLIETVITNENGEAISKDLEAGRYIIKEVRKKKRLFKE